MQKSRSWLLILVILFSVGLFDTGYAQTAEDYYKKGQTAYNEGQMQQALDLFQQATQKDPNLADAYFNMGAIYFNLKRYTDSLQAFNKLLQIDPQDQAARYETGRVYEKLERYDEAIAAFEMIGPTSSRYSKALENIALLQEKKLQQKQAKQNEPVVSTTSGSLVSSGKIMEVAGGFFGPTGIAVDDNGVLYVANFSKNTITKVSPMGDQRLFASGTGINGPVGMSIDRKTGDLYIANHLDNTVSKVSPNGTVTIVASGLKKPYNLFLDESSRTLYVSQQETNSVARIKLN